MGPLRLHIIVLCGLLLGLAAGDHALAFEPTGGEPSWERAAEDLERLHAERQELQEQARSLDQRYLRGVEESRRARRLRRLVDGQQLYLLEDFESAALVLMEVVADPDARALPGYDDARFMLAESLRRAGRPALAERYFRDFVRENHPEHALAAAIQLLEIAFEEQRFEDLGEIYDVLPRLQGHADADRLNYVAGKALHRQGRHAEGIAILERIAPQSSYYERAAYYIATLLAVQGELAQALERYQQQEARLVEQEGETAADLRDLVALAQGRLHYELGNLDEAITAYARVRRQSRHFDRALYETSWTLIRESRYLRAARALETLGLVSVDPRIGPEAVLLRGEMELRLDDFTAAYVTFSDLRSEYEPVEDALALHVQFLERLLDEPGESAAGSELLRVTPTARPWVDLDPRARQALQTLSDFDELERELRQLERVIRELDRALDGSRQLQAFPELSEGWNLSHVMEAEAASLRAQAVDHLGAAVADRMLPHEAERLADLRRLREELYRTLQAVPESRRALELRQREARAEIRDQELGAFRKEQELMSALERADALEAMLREGQLDLGPDEERREKVLEEVATLRARASTLEGELETLRDALQDLRAGSAAAGLVSRSERDVLRDYATALRQEQAYLRPFIYRLAPPDGAAAPAEDAELATLTRLEAELQDARSEIVEGLMLAQSLRNALATGDSPEERLRELAAVEAELQAQMRRIDAQEVALREELVAQSRRRGVEADALEATLQRQRARELAPLDAQEATARRRVADSAMLLGAGLDELTSVLSAFVDAVTSLVDAEGERLRARLLLEADALDGMSRRLASTRSDGHHVAVASAKDAVDGVRERFHEINLRANLGIIDISWRQREQQVAELERLVQDRAQVLELLDMDFADILEAN